MAKESYQEFLKRTLSGMIDRLDLDEFRKDALKSRWLEQLLWLESRAAKAKRLYYTLRLITIVGGVITPTLVSLNQPQLKLREAFAWTAFGMAQAVAISAAVEELFGFGVRYRTFRNTAEGMKVEGWQYFQLTGQYSYYRSHFVAYTEFAGRVEALIKQDIEGYLSQVQQADEATRQAREQAREAAVSSTAITIERLNQILAEREKDKESTPPPRRKEPEPEPRREPVKPEAKPEPVPVSTTSSPSVKDDESEVLPPSAERNGEAMVATRTAVGIADLSVWENFIELPEVKPEPKDESGNGSQKGRRINAAGLRILKECEGLYLNAYKCPSGVWTIGYGCTEGIRPGMTITEVEAEERLMKELSKFEQGVDRRLSHIPLNDNQFSALVSLTYNCGFDPIIEGNTIRRKLEARDYQGAADGFLLWNKGGAGGRQVLQGLVKRREMERKLFLSEV
jgi:GH24 family phage-related lysozyme (muramidase)